MIEVILIVVVLVIGVFQLELLVAVAAAVALMVGRTLAWLYLRQPVRRAAAQSSLFPA